MKTRLTECAERLGDAQGAAVVVRVEVGELMHTAAGEEALPRAGRVGPAHGRLEHAGEAAIRPGGDMVGPPSAVSGSVAVAAATLSSAGAVAAKRACSSAMISR